MSSEALEQTLAPQHQARQPGIESPIVPPLQSRAEDYVGSGQLDGKVALIAGGDSGIGRAVAIAFANEGADVAFIYLSEHGDALRTVQAIRSTSRRCLRIPVDVGDESLCRDAVSDVLANFGRLDILVNPAGEQHPQDRLEDITEGQLLRTFQTNVFSMFFLTKAALPHLKPGARIINTASVTAYRGSPHLLDYSATKGAVVAFTRSLSLALVERGILVNAVAPGPVWTPLISSSFGAQEVAHFGADTPMKRPGQPDEVAHCYVFLASAASAYMSGQVLHPNGGEVING
jgi:NAD(P)-dependent dehydrogenase (short-subunit alcohol dehydrogenase family)